MYKRQQSKLSYIGLMTDDDGKLTIDRDILAGALSPDRMINKHNLSDKIQQQIAV